MSHYIRPHAPLGLGHAVLCSRPVVSGEPFLVHSADDLIDAAEPCLKQMARALGECGGSVLGVETIEPSKSDKYGIAALLADEAVYAYAFAGKRCDCGSKLGHLQATVHFALKHEDLGKLSAEHVAQVVAERLHR